MSKISRTVFSAKDARRLAGNVGKEFQDMDRRISSVAVCFDALLSVLDRESDAHEGKPSVTARLKEEIERRKELAKAKNANPPVKE